MTIFQGILSSSSFSSRLGSSALISIGLHAGLFSTSLLISRIPTQTCPFFFFERNRKKSSVASVTFSQLHSRRCSVFRRTVFFFYICFFFTFRCLSACLCFTLDAQCVFCSLDAKHLEFLLSLLVLDERKPACD